MCYSLADAFANLQRCTTVDEAWTLLFILISLTHPLHFDLLHPSLGSVCAWLHHTHRRILVLALSRGICSKLANLLALLPLSLRQHSLHLFSYKFASLLAMANITTSWPLKVDEPRDRGNEWGDWNEATRMTLALLFPFARRSEEGEKMGQTVLLFHCWTT